MGLISQRSLSLIQMTSFSGKFLRKKVIPKNKALASHSQAQIMHRSVFQEKKKTQLPILSDLTESNITGDITTDFW